MSLSIWLLPLLCTIESPVLAVQNASPVTTQSQAKPPAGWQYQQGTTVYKATLNSANLLELAYPYAGGSTVTLTIRNQSGSITAFLSVSKGMLTPSFQGGTALIRFNGGKPVTYSLSPAANGRGNLLFVDDSPRLIRQLRTARTMTVQLQVIGQKLNEIRFNPAGLRWN